LASSVTNNPKIAFVGTGAQGAAIGADFALAGFDVTFIEQWPAHVEAIRKKGITVNLPARTINARVPALHFCQVAEIKEKFDLIFLVVKAYDTKWVTQMVEPIVARDGFVIGLQNGMSHLDIASVVGAERTIGAVIEIASNMFVPGITNRQNDHEESWFALGAVVAWIYAAESFGDPAGQRVVNTFARVDDVREQVEEVLGVRGLCDQFYGAAADAARGDDAALRAMRGLGRSLLGQLRGVS